MEIIRNGNTYSSKVWLPDMSRAHYIGLRHKCWLAGALRSVVPHVSLENLSGLLLIFALVAPRMVTYLFIYPCCRLVFGTLYPAYASYKAVRAKNLKEYVKWMMYWIVFALFTCAETFTDVFLSWFPFYYEVKIVLVMWLLSPATGGSSILYRKFVHPALCRREQFPRICIFPSPTCQLCDYEKIYTYHLKIYTALGHHEENSVFTKTFFAGQCVAKWLNGQGQEIDEYISKAKEQGYHTVLNLGTKGVNYATTVIMQTAIKGGGGLVQQLKKSYSLVDLSDSDQRSRNEQELLDEVDDVITDPRLIRRSVGRRGYSPRRSASESNNRMYFSEVDISRGSSTAGRNIINDFSHIKSSEDISSGYSSADNSATRDATLTRTSSVGASTRTRTRQMATRSTFTTIKRPSAAEESEVIIEELHDDDVDDDIIFPVNIYPQYDATSPSLHLSQTNPPFLFEIVNNKINIIKILDSTGFGTVESKIKANVDKHNVNYVNYNSFKLNLSDENKVKADKDIEENNDVKSSKSTAETTNDYNEVPPGEFQIKITNTCEPNISENKTETLLDEEKVIGSEKIEKLNVTNFNVSTSNSSTSFHSNQNSLHLCNYDSGDTTSLDISVANLSTADSDDNGSFVTPESSPVMRKKKLKQIKRKAPSAPNIIDNIDSHDIKDTQLKQGDHHDEKTSENMSKIEKTPIGKNSLKSERNKHGSPISKLMQLPGKFIFWQKTASTSGSENNSRRTSLENIHVLESHRDSKYMNDINISVEDTPPPTKINPIVTCSNSLSENKDNNEASTLLKNAESVIEKGTILQKLIEAKLDSHPEYKIISLHNKFETIPGSKSTEV